MKIHALLVFGILLTLSACGGGGGSGFAGTVTAPAGATVKGTVVTACFYLAATDSCDPDKSKITSISTSGNSGSFSIEGLAVGDYAIIAVNEAQGLLGLYLDNQGNAAIVKPPRSGINIQLVQPQ